MKYQVPVQGREAGLETDDAAGQPVYGRCVRNVCGGAVVWQDAQG